MPKLCFVIFKVLQRLFVHKQGQKMIFCFSGPGAFVFFTPLQIFYSKNRAHNFDKLNFFYKKLTQFFCPPPSTLAFGFFPKKVPVKQKIKCFGLIGNILYYTLYFKLKSTNTLKNLNIAKKSIRLKRQTRTHGYVVNNVRV